MINILNIEECEFFNKDYIKVFDGIAGSAKSSTCARVLNNAGVPFLRCTSTNKLRKDAAARFGGNNATIAGGLFKTNNGQFYDEEKPTEYQTVLIDEALQADMCVFEWCRNNVGKVNIIICTDSQQMLPPTAGENTLSKYRRFCEEPFVIYKKLTDTLRPADGTTKQIYDECYDAVNDVFQLFWKYRSRFHKVNFSTLSYNTEDAFICHTNEIEKFLYINWDLASRYDVPLIPKGNLSSKEDVDITKYPIVPQADIKNLTNYLQVENIGTVTRYQGSEVQVGHRLIFFVEKHSSVENRELYTMITRAKRFDDIYLCTVDVPKKAEFTTYNGKPIIDKVIENVSSETICDTVPHTIAQAIAEYGELTEYQKNRVLQKLNEGRTTEKVVGFVVDGKPLKSTKRPSTRITMSSLIKKEPLLRADFMGTFYQEMDRIQKERNGRVLIVRENIWTPVNIDRHLTMKDEYTYGVDLYSSYPHAFKEGPLPDGRLFYTKAEKSDYDAEKENLLRFYMNYSLYGSIGMIMTGELVDYLKEYGKDIRPDDFEYIGACRKLKTTKIGDYLMKKAYASKESKQVIKEVHYGYLQKSYLEVAYRGDNGKALSYIVNENQNLELVMVAVQSTQAIQILKMKQAVYGNIEDGRQLVDCLYFNTETPLNIIGDLMHSALVGYDFRIFKNEKKGKTADKEIVYQTYETLKKRSHHKKATS